MDKRRRQTLVSWGMVGTLIVLFGILGALQFRWIGEVGQAERERMRSTLQANLQRLSREFNSELVTACLALMPVPRPDAEVSEADYAERYDLWKDSSERDALIKTVAIAVPQGETLSLRVLNQETALFHSAEWPAGWGVMRDRLERRLRHDRRDGPPPPEGEGDGDNDLLVEVPRFVRVGGDGPGPDRREAEWMIVEFDVDYLKDTYLPELIQRHLGSHGGLDYHVEVTTNGPAPKSIYRSGEPLGKTVDASVALWSLPRDFFFRRGGPPGTRRGGMRGPGPGVSGPGESGRWQLSVQHQSGSLEAVVARTRWKNLAVSGGILLVMLAAIVALMQYTRQAQQLASLQVDFVAGVSHDLKTPLAVIQTLAYNLQGKMATKPEQVAKYGSLIQQESQKLTALVEQVLQFASARADRLVRNRKPVVIEDVISESIASTRAAVGGARFELEEHVEPGLPLVLGDSLALRQAVQNLLTNAVKYGTEGSDWIGVFAVQVVEGNRTFVEIRVADRGPGIPAEEQRKVFEPFFRGRHAVEDQVRGTGLGLSLVQDIVKAHGGTMAVHSAPGQGTEFVMHIPAAPPEYQDEFTHPAR